MNCGNLISIGDFPLKPLFLGVFHLDVSRSPPLFLHKLQPFSPWCGSLSVHPALSRVSCAPMHKIAGGFDKCTSLPKNVSYFLNLDFQSGGSLFYTLFRSMELCLATGSRARKFVPNWLYWVYCIAPNIGLNGENDDESSTWAYPHFWTNQASKTKLGTVSVKNQQNAGSKEQTNNCHHQLFCRSDWVAPKSKRVCKDGAGIW